MYSSDIYIVEDGCVVKKKGNNFLVTKNNEKLMDLPYSKIDRIFLIGSQSITPQAVEFALDKEKDILFLSKYGKVMGTIKSNSTKNVFLKLAQYEIWRNKEKRFDFAKNIVKGKVQNQNNLLKRYKINEFNIDRIFHKINNSNDIASLMGIEGECSRLYFKNFDKIILSDLKFEKRTRRPPENEFNALLSLTYSLTTNNILWKLEMENLDSYIGYLHNIKYGRESLALDILEEFRTICDYIVIKWVNRKEFKKIDFVKSEGGIFLTENSLRKYFEKYNKEYDEKLKQNIERQVNLLKKSILEDKIYKTLDVKF